MTHIASGPRPVEFRTIKNLHNRMHPEPGDNVSPISVLDAEVPSWQRNVVWTDEEMGLLALSIIMNYPIGLVILWRKPNGIRVPIDGRQRLSAIDAFYGGRVAIPNLPGVPLQLQNAKYVLLPGDEPKYHILDLKDRERFADYEPQMVEFELIAEEVAMDIFIKLQGGKSLTKNEVRSALGGLLCDYVTELTSPSVATGSGDEDEIEPPSHHPFFQQVNVRNIRKAHRNLCDVLLHEQLYPGTNKHWSSLETMYREKALTLSGSERSKFRSQLAKFQTACSQSVDGKRVLLPQLRSAFLILSIYRAWNEIDSNFAKPTGFDFAGTIAEFERLRVEKKDEVPWVNFTSALSNAGYAENRIEERHRILMSFILRKYQGMRLKDKTRAFSEEQKIAIWDRAGKQCEQDGGGVRCSVVFANFREADADHVVRWTDGGATSLSNGRLLCQAHNRSGEVLAS